MAEALSLEVILKAVDEMTAPVRRALGAGQDFKKGTADIAHTLRGLHKVQNDVDSYKKMTTAINQTDIEIKESSAILASLRRQYDATEQPTAKLTNALNRAEMQHLKLTQRRETESIKLEKYKSRVEQAGYSTKELAKTEKLLESRIESTAKTLNGYDQSVNSAAEHTQKLKLEQKQLNAHLKDIEGISKLRGQLNQTQLKIKQSTESLEKLQKAAMSAGPPNAKLAQKMESLALSIELAKNKEAEQSRKLAALENNLESAGYDTKHLADTQKKLSTELHGVNTDLEKQNALLNDRSHAIDRNVKSQQSLQNARSRMQDKLQMYQDVAGVAYPALGAGTATLYGASQPIAKSATHTDMVNDIAITGGMSLEDERLLREELRQIALATNQKQERINKGVQVLVANGMSAKSGKDAEELKGYAHLQGDVATASRAEIEDIANITFSLKNSLKIEGKEEMREAFNYLVHAGKLGQFELKEMARYLPSLAANIASMGGTGMEAVKELGVAMQAARKTAGTSQEAAANLANWFSHMTANSTVTHFDDAGIDYEAEVRKRMQHKDPEKRMSAFRASFDVFDMYLDKLTAGQKMVFKTGSGKIKATLNFKDALAQAAKDGNKEEVMKVVERFGLSMIIQDMQTANAYLAMRQNSDFIESSMKSFDDPNVQNTIETDKARRMLSPLEQAKQAKIGFDDSMVQFGETIWPMLTPLLEHLTLITEQITKWAKENPELVSTIIKVAAVTGSLMVGFGGVAMTIISILGPLALSRYALALLGNSVRSTGQTLLRFMPILSKVGRLLKLAFSRTGIGIIVAGLALLVNNLDTVSGYLKNFGDAFYKGFIEPLSLLAPDIVNRLQAAIAPIQPFIDKVKSLFTGVVDWIKGLFGFDSTVYEAAKAGERAGEALANGLLGKTVELIYNGIDKLSVAMKWLADNLGETGGGVASFGLLGAALFALRHPIKTVTLLLKGSIGILTKLATVAIPLLISGAAKLGTALLFLARSSMTILITTATKLGTTLLFLARSSMTILITTATKLGTTLLFLARNAIPVLMTAVRLLAGVIIANPIIAAIAAIATAAWLIVDNWGAVSNWFSGAWQSALSTWNNVKASLSDTTWGQILLTAINVVTTPLRLLWGVAQWLGEYWTKTVGSFSDTSWSQLLLGAINLLLNPFEHFKLITSALKDVWELTKNSLAKTGWGQTILDTITTITGKFNWAKEQINKFKTWWNDLSFTSKSATVAANLPPETRKISTSVSGGYVRMRDRVGAPTFAGTRAMGGGIGANQIAKVVERGPELFTQGSNTYLLSRQAGHVSPLVASINHKQLTQAAALSAANDNDSFASKSSIEQLNSLGVTSINKRQNNATMTSNREHSNATMQITINVNAETGADPHMIAEAIEQKFRQLERERDAERRGANYDLSD